MSKVVMSNKRKDFFGLRYPNLEPIYLDRFGIEFQISGMLVAGKDDKRILILLPGQELHGRKYINFAEYILDIVQPSRDEWIQILKQADDPEYYETSPDGKIVKAIHRKCQRQIGYEVQWEVYRKAGFKCEYCHNERPLSIDHKQPVELGGTDEESNLAAACRPCNREKGNMPYEEWVKILKERGWLKENE